MNAIDYNPVLDQIVMSVPYFNEMWIIDHSTTMSEAAAHTGGNTGKGGDLIFRWGNPATYDRGDESDKQLYFQHDVSWVNPTATMLDTTFGQISVYNNQAPGGQSPGQVVSTQVMDGSFNYPMTDGVFAPADFSRTVVYPGTDPRSASVSLSSVQFLSNGNTLLLAGRWGFAYEVDTNGELVWEYIVPLKTGSPATQGDTLVINNNLTFRMQRYAADYSAFEGKNMSPKDYLESEPNEGFCALLLPAPEEEPAAFNFRIYPNPTRDVLHIETFDLPTHLHDLSLYDL